MVNHVTTTINGDDHLGAIFIRPCPLALADASHMGLMKVIDLTSNMNPTQSLFCLTNHPFDQLSISRQLSLQSLNGFCRFLFTFRRKLLYFPFGPLKGWRNSFDNLMSISCDLAQAYLNPLFSILAQFIDLHHHLLVEPTKTTNSSNHLHTVAMQTPDDANQTLPTSVEKLTIGGIFKILGLGRGIHKPSARTDLILRNQHPPEQLPQGSVSTRPPDKCEISSWWWHLKTTRPHLNPALSDTQIPGLQFDPTKDHPGKVLMQALYKDLIRKIKPMH